ncbi:MAG TPA: hypothetical protein VHF88_06575 [Thermoleophilaceae bacterium]|nr:hypothetical protein [Thermoleophilaceae bacterium]
MVEHEATLEDLPPLELLELRLLDLEAPSHPGRPAHVSAASGVVQRGDFAYVIGDDELFLAVFRVSDQSPGRLHRALGGDLPLGHDDRKRAKPDLEVLTALPPFGSHAHGALLGLGSGSKPNRDRGFVWGLAPDGSLDGEPYEIDLEPLYARLRESVDDLNVEGAAVMGDGLWLLQRGNGERGVNVVTEVALDEALDALLRDRAFVASELRAMRSYDLGRLGDAKLTFSDASPLGDELLVFTASAEASPDTFADGEIAGSVVGTIGRDGEVRRLREIDSDHKVEGVHAALDAGVATLTLVCDQDDAEAASPLLSATLPLDQEEKT